MTVLVSRLFSLFLDNNSKLLDVVIRLDYVDLIFDELFSGRMKGLLLLSSLRFISILLEPGVQVTFE